MKLSLDIFQLIGVSPGASANNLLMILERRLEKCSYHDFSQDTLKRRNKLLTEYGKILLNSKTAQDTASGLQHNQSEEVKSREIILAPGDEVAGLLLALESSQYEECLYFSNEILAGRKEEKSTLTSRDTDIRLIGAYSALEYSKLLIRKRYYESCSEVLEKALQQVKGDPLLSKIEHEISTSLERITPFRILDLLSRDMDEVIRDQGIILLQAFVSKRGGLDYESNVIMDDSEFKSFFRQIRYFLTVQEQIDLFEKWYEEGSETAGFLLAIALVASGFAQRKPSRLVTAVSIMKDLNSEELMSIVRYTSLLLGNVDTKSDNLDFSNQIREQHNQIANTETELAELCGDCREWLARDVLEGYRDIDVDADLEAYFSDKDVTSFIEDTDKKISLERKPRSLFGPKEKNIDVLQKNITNTAARINGKGNNNKSSQPTANETLSTSTKRNRVRLGTGLAILVACITVLAWSFRVEKNQKKDKVVPRVLSKANESKRQLLKDVTRTSTSDVVSRRLEKKPSPDKIQVQTLLSEWLVMKAQTLAGLPMPERINHVGSENAIKILSLERKDDNAKGHKQIISAKPTDVSILNTSNQRIEILATIAYADKIIDATGKVIAETPNHVFKKIYTLVNIDGKWLVE